jgi:hypothetical protein
MNDPEFQEFDQMIQVRDLWLKTLYWCTSCLFIALMASAFLFPFERDAALISVYAAALISILCSVAFAREKAWNKKINDHIREGFRQASVEIDKKRLYR